MHNPSVAPPLANTPALAMARIVTLGALLLVGMGCEGSENETITGDPLAQQANRDLVIDMYDVVFNEHELDRTGDFLAEDYIQHNPLVEQGRAGFVAFFEPFFAAAPDTAVELLEVVAEGDRVMVYTRFTGTYEGMFAGVEVAQKPFDFFTADVYRVEGDALAEHWDVVDQLALLTQLGLL